MFSGIHCTNIDMLNGTGFVSLESNIQLGLPHSTVWTWSLFSSFRLHFFDVLNDACPTRTSQTSEEKSSLFFFLATPFTWMISFILY